MSTSDQSSQSPFPQRLVVSIAPQTMILAIGLLVGLYFLAQIQQIIVSVFMAFILMAALNPLVKKAERRLRLPKVFAILLVYLLILVGIGLLIWLVIPPLAAELPNFINTLALPQLPESIRTMKFDVNQLSVLVTQLRGSLGALASVIGATFSGFFTAFTVMVMAAYLLLDRDRLYLKMSWFTRQPRHLELTRQLLNTIEENLGGWVRGQLGIMLIIGIVSYVLLRILGVPYAVPLAILSGLLEVLPNLGPTLAAIPAMLVALLTMSPTMALFVGVTYAIVQTLENNIIVPKLIKDTADVNPFVTIVAVLIGFSLSGVIGAFLSVPVYIVIRAAYSMWMKEFRNKSAEC